MIRGTRSGGAQVKRPQARSTSCGLQRFAAANIRHYNMEVNGYSGELSRAVRSNERKHEQTRPTCKTDRLGTHAEGGSRSPISGPPGPYPGSPCAWVLNHSCSCSGVADPQSDSFLRRRPKNTHRSEG